MEERVKFEVNINEVLAADAMKMAKRLDIPFSRFVEEVVESYVAEKRLNGKV